MKNYRFQCKDIPTFQILSVLSETSDPSNIVIAADLADCSAFPHRCDEKLFHAKMATLIKRGLVGGFAGPGLRGDFHITKTGREFLASLTRGMVFESLNNAAGGGHGYIKAWSVPEIVEDLISYCSDFEDSTVEFLSPYVQEWKDKQNENPS